MAEVARDTTRVRTGLAAGLLVLAATSGCASQSGSSDAATQGLSAARGPSASPTRGPSHHVSPRTGGGGAPPRTSDPSASGYDDTSGTDAAPPTSQTSVLTSLPGSREPGCVDVGRHRDMRSGSVAMGDFATARAAYHRDGGAYDAPPLFFYVIPQSRSVRAVTVTATRVDGTSAPVHLTSRQVEQAAQWSYFPLHLVLPAAGTWRFRVSASDQQGCFVASFAR
jgi:hypothetical protein